MYQVEKKETGYTSLNGYQCWRRKKVGTKDKYKQSTQYLFFNFGGKGEWMLIQSKVEMVFPLKGKKINWEYIDALRYFKLMLGKISKVQLQDKV